MAFDQNTWQKHKVAGVARLRANSGLAQSVGRAPNHNGGCNQHPSMEGTQLGFWPAKDKN